jgi:hypothetical protein
LFVIAVSACHLPSASLGLKPEQITQLITSAAQSNGWLVDPVGPMEVRARRRLDQVA